MRLLFDENLSALSAQWVTSTLAVDVLDARSAGLAGKTDQEIRQFAVETGRILVTLDADFGNLIRYHSIFTGQYSGSYLASASAANRSERESNSW